MPSIVRTPRGTMRSKHPARLRGPSALVRQRAPRVARSCTVSVRLDSAPPRRRSWQESTLARQALTPLFLDRSARIALHRERPAATEAVLAFVRRGDSFRYKWNL